MRKLPPSLRQWVISTTAIVVIVLGTLVLVAFAQGYSLDIKSWKLRANGLVLIDSTPNGANISINDKPSNKKTPFRYTNAPPGDILLNLYKSDYRSWSAKQKVFSSQVTFLDYAILLPNILAQQSITTNNNTKYSGVFQSSDHSKYIGISSDNLTLYNLTDLNQPKVIYQASGDASKQILSMEVAQLSYDGSKVLLSQKLSSGKIELLVANANGLPPENLTRDFGFEFKNLVFNQKDSNELFWLDNTELKKIRLASKSISSNIVSNVIDISVEKDRLLVVKPTTEITQTQLFSYDLSGQDEKSISKLSASTAGYDLAFISSRYNEYVLVKYNDNNSALLIKDPYSQSSVTQLGDGVGMFNISPNQRFLVLSQNSLLRCLDLEFSQDYNFNTSLHNLQSWTWYDNYHIVMQKSQQLLFVDFDGQNNQLLTPIADVKGFFISASDKAIFPLNTTGELFKLWLVKK